MGDRTYTSIGFTGVISEEQAAELADLLRDQGCEAHNGGHLLDALKEGDGFYDNECNYATMEDIESWCGENEVGYLKSWSAGGDYGPGLELWRPGMTGAEQCPSVDDSPVATLTELTLAHKDGAVLDLIERLDRFTSLGPALKVLAVEDWTPELCVFMAKRKLEIEDAPQEADA
jgi:hypothetical protein